MKKTVLIILAVLLLFSASLAEDAGTVETLHILDHYQVTAIIPNGYTLDVRDLDLGVGKGGFQNRLIGFNQHGITRLSLFSDLDKPAAISILPLGRKIFQPFSQARISSNRSAACR